MPVNSGGLVYGTILVATLLAAEPPRRETFAKTVAAVAISVIVYWLSMSYAEFTGERLREDEAFTPAAYARAAVHELPVVFGTLGPLLALLICWAAGVALATAVTVAIWTSVAIIIATEVVLGVRAELTGRQLVIQTGMGVLLGLLVVALRVLLH
jgi:hypothetical protein